MCASTFWAFSQGQAPLVHVLDDGIESLGEPKRLDVAPSDLQVCCWMTTNRSNMVTSE